MVKTTEFYDLLGVSPDASTAEIKTVYRKLVQDCHPDVIRQRFRRRYETRDTIASTDSKDSAEVKVEKCDSTADPMVAPKMPSQFATTNQSGLGGGQKHHIEEIIDDEIIGNDDPIDIGNDDIIEENILPTNNSSQDHEDKEAKEDQVAKEEAEVARLTQKFKKISRAYEVLIDEKLRRRYDRGGEEEIDRATPEPVRPRPAFPMFGRRPLRKGPSVKIPMKVSLEDAFCGKSLHVRFNRQQYCQNCDGLGGFEIDDCPICSGKGFTKSCKRSVSGKVIQQQQSTCQNCKGEGNVCTRKCLRCGGHKLLITEVLEEITIPAGSKTGDIVILDGKGNHIRKRSLPGDLEVELNIDDHPRFYRRGDNLYTHARLELVQALCGGEIVIEHMDRRQILVKFKRIIQPTQLYSIHREGMPNKDSGEKGDLIVKIDLHLPGRLNEGQREQLRTLLHRASLKAPKLKNDYYETEFQPYDGRWALKGDIDDPEVKREDPKKKKNPFGPFPGFSTHTTVNGVPCDSSEIPGMENFSNMGGQQCPSQ